jgi:membrane protease YdiL (CAAX protease family)
MTKSTQARSSAVGDRRFGRLLERADGRDFPFYNGSPIEIPAWKWVLMVVACAAGFAALTLIPYRDNAVALVPRSLFVVIPLAMFVALAGRFWTAIFRRLSWGDVLTMIVFWLINAAVTFVVGALVAGVFGATANRATDNLAAAAAGEVFLFFLGTGIQLFGEELFTILPLLAVLYLLHAKAGLTRTTAVLLSWLITAVWFGAAHLATYDFNVAQAIVVIGIARLILTLAFIRTKNILVSTGAHILNDWSGFAFALAVAGASP